MPFSSERTTEEISRIAREINARRQQPKSGQITFEDLQWTSVGTTGGQALVEAYIPYERVEDFIQGESKRSQSYFTQACVKLQPFGSLRVPRDTSATRKVTYTCEYGPEDYRTGSAGFLPVKASGRCLARPMAVWAYKLF